MANKIVRNLPDTEIKYSVIEEGEIKYKAIKVPYCFESVENATAYLNSRLGINGIATEIHTDIKRYEMSIETFIENATYIATK